MNKSRRGTNWESELQTREVLNKIDDGKEIKVVLLLGLRRLAEEAGIKRSKCIIQHIPGPRDGGRGLIQCIYSAEFDDGTEWVGTADCNQYNTSEEFLHYPTAVAESRAESRCLRKALGISMLSFEEIGFNVAIESLETKPDEEISSSVIKAIEMLCQEKNIDPIVVLENIIDNKERANNIFQFDQLTAEEGQKAMSFLNSFETNKPVPKKKKITAAEKRKLRKVELEKKLNES